MSGITRYPVFHQGVASIGLFALGPKVFRSSTFGRNLAIASMILLLFQQYFIEAIPNNNKTQTNYKLKVLTSASLASLLFFGGIALYQRKLPVTLICFALYSLNLSSLNSYYKVCSRNEMLELNLKWLKKTYNSRTKSACIGLYDLLAFAIGNLASKTFLLTPLALNVFIFRYQVTASLNISALLLDKIKKLFKSMPKML